MAGEPFEAAQPLEAGDPQPARAHRRDRRRLALRMTGDVGRVQHDLREARLAHRAQLRLERPRERDRIHAEVIEIHKGVRAIFRLQLGAEQLSIGVRKLLRPLYGLRWLWTSSKVAPPR